MLNQCVFMGRLTRDPELRYTAGAEPKAVAKFGIAVARDYTIQKEKITDFFEVETWHKTAEFAGKYLSKGQLICLQGSLYRSSWETQNGEKRFSYYIEARNIYFAEGKKEETPYSDNEKAEYAEMPDNFDPFEDEM